MRALGSSARAHSFVFKEHRYFPQLEVRTLAHLSEFVLDFATLHLRFRSTGDKFASAHREGARERFGDASDEDRAFTGGASSDAADGASRDEQPTERTAHELANPTQARNALLLGKERLIRLMRRLFSWIWSLLATIVRHTHHLHWAAPLGCSIGLLHRASACRGPHAA
jgi:hypothetical protein